MPVVHPCDVNLCPPLPVVHPCNINFCLSLNEWMNDDCFLCLYNCCVKNLLTIFFYMAVLHWGIVTQPGCLYPYFLAFIIESEFLFFGAIELLNDWWSVCFLLWVTLPGCKVADVTKINYFEVATQQMCVYTIIVE